MGHRANHVIKENGRISLFYSHWGAKTVPADVFWGPVPAEAFIRTNAPLDHWLDEADAEGGIALDKDSRSACFFGMDDMSDEGPIEAEFLRLCRYVWKQSGWSIDYRRELGDLVEFTGLRRGDVIPERPSPLPFPIERIGENCAKGSVAALIYHRTAQGATDRVLDFTLTGFLLNGPIALSHLARLLSLEDLRARPASTPAPPVRRPMWERIASFWKRPSSGDPLPDRLRAAGLQPFTPAPLPYNQALTAFAIVDEVSREIIYSESWETCAVEHVARAWPGWTVRKVEGGVEGYFARTGRPVPPDLIPPPVEVSPMPEMTMAEIHEEIERYLFDASGAKDHLDRVAKTFRAAQDGPDTYFAPGFSDRVPELPLSLEERRRIWAQALAHAP
ncbi:MAG: hypothetical protein JNL98_05225 [Bryobacterales bacterium]|nr:hypothetical protein [Bryobacterales bacterium]